MIYEGKAITVKALESGIVELNFDLKGESVNKFNRLTLNDLRQAVDAIKADASVKGVIVTSGKDVFIVGADITEFVDNFKLPDEELVAGNLEANKIFSDFEDLGVPTVVAINGIALGGGAELAYAADFRIATPALKMGQPETSLGITAAAGAQWRLKELVGEPVALELLLAGRILDAQEALELKLVTELHEPEALLDAADALADRIAQQDPLAVRLSKRVFHLPREAHPHVDEIAQAILFESEAKFERMQAFLDRKKK